MNRARDLKNLQALQFALHETVLYLDAHPYCVQAMEYYKDIQSKAKKLKAKLKETGINVIMTRNSYGGLYGTTAKGFKKRDLEKRVNIINSARADAMVSIHLNCYSSSSRRGATTFFCKGKVEGEILAQSIQKHFNTLSGQPKDYSSLKGDYYLLNESNCPSVICECGFLSSPEDEKLLITEEYQNEIAEKIFRGIVEYLRLGE
jgi:N-acetylmuramoyl-L-alanine amidase